MSVAKVSRVIRGLCIIGIVVSSGLGFLKSGDAMLSRLYFHQTAGAVRDLEAAGVITIHEDVISEIAKTQTDAGYVSWKYIGLAVAEDTYLEGEEISESALYFFKICGGLGVLLIVSIGVGIASVEKETRPHCAEDGE